MDDRLRYLNLRWQGRDVIPRGIIYYRLSIYPPVADASATYFIKGRLESDPPGPKLGAVYLDLNRGQLDSNKFEDGWRTRTSDLRLSSPYIRS